MPRPRLLVVIGTRPEAIKLAPVVAALRRASQPVECLVCTTGQHVELLEPLLDQLDVRPDVRLDALIPGQSLARLTARLVDRLDATLERLAPDWLVAQGDTSSVLAAALAAFYRRVPLAHVEAGLRSGRLDTPFPEELNRRVATLSAALHFAPTAAARDRLVAEGVEPSRIELTGNTVVDAFQLARSRHYDWTRGPLAALPANRRWVLVTAHRRESHGAPLTAICRAVRHLAADGQRLDTHLVVMQHPHPDVASTVREQLAGCANVTLLPPLDYLSLVQLLCKATLLLTDSGGLQEEAPSAGVPTLVLRQVTERPEAVDRGLARLVGTDTATIVDVAKSLLSSETLRQRMIAPENPFGDGRAAERIVARLLAEIRRERPQAAPLDQASAQIEGTS